MACVLVAGSAHADPTSGIDAALFRQSYDTGGIFAVEGARLMPRRDISFKIMLGYGKAPINAAVPGVGPAENDTGKDAVLHDLTILDLAFGMSLTDAFAIGLDVAAYRTSTGAGYGVRGRYAAGTITSPSTGLISLRPLSNIDPSADPSDASAYLGDGLAGPLDAHLGFKYRLVANPTFALAAIASVFLPFGNEQMLLGDSSFVFEPKVAAEWRHGALRVVGNVGARIRQRAVLQAYDTMNPMATAADAKAFLDVGSEAVIGAGATYEITPRITAALEAQLFTPLPASFDIGSCHLENSEPCSSLTSGDYWQGAKSGDRTGLATVGAMIRLTPDVTANIMLGAGVGGARAEDYRVTTGIAWAPQPVGADTRSRGDRDGDGVPDATDACPDEPEDRDGFQDDDGCPDPDNDGDGIPDAKDKCPNEPEDKDGFQDEDGCPDPDNDGDGIPDSLDKCPNDPEDKDGFQDEDGCPDPDNDGDGIPDVKDKCPNDPETVNGFEDEDGCPDVRATAGPQERADRIDLEGQPVAFGKNNATLTPQAKQLLVQVATIIKAHKLTVRVEVHVPLGAKAKTPAQLAAQHKLDKQLAQRRANAILEVLLAQGVTQPQIQAVGIGSERPLGTSDPSDPTNARVDFIKAQQGGAP